jgi:hypothetical protein
MPPTDKTEEFDLPSLPVETAQSPTSLPRLRWPEVNRDRAALPELQ